MKFLIIKSLFCPTYEYYETNMNSLMKINEHIELIKMKCLDVQFDLYLMGWIYLYEKNINSFISSHKINFTEIHKDLWPINFGKYKMYNQMQNWNHKN